MTLAELSIKRPTFITCIVLVMLAVGLLAMNKLGVDLFPDVTFPVVVVTTAYPGAGTSEIETLVSKPLEDEISTLSGLKRLTSVNQEGVSTVVGEFNLETDVKFAEQQIRDRVGSAKHNLPQDIKEPVIRRIDPGDMPVLTLSVKGDLEESKLYDVANEWVRPKLEQVNQVGLVEVIGGRKREIRVVLDRNKLKAHEISATQVAQRISAAGEDVPAGKTDRGARETVFRTLGQFKSIHDIESTIVNFFGSDVPTAVSDVGIVTDGMEDEKARTFVNGQKSLTISVYRQSGANTIAVVDQVLAQVRKINQDLANSPGKPSIDVIRDASIWIHSNVEDVKESIFIGITLAMIVVFFFLGNGRSTIITGLAIPNSLIGAFLLMAVAGFTINIMTLLALSLSVGLLIDDAIVVRENIFRHIEQGKKPIQAALEGTAEVSLAVVATTLTVIAVFGPVAFLSGVVGQFFKAFGATICFIMAISLFDALTIAPMLSAYFAGAVHREDKRSLWARTVGRPLAAFGRFQDALDRRYEKLLGFSLDHPLKTLFAGFLVFVICIAAVARVPKTFLPAQDAGEFAVRLDLPPGTNLDAMNAVAAQTDGIIRKNPEVRLTSLTVGNQDGEANVAELYISLVPSKNRKFNTTQIKERIRDQLKVVANANPKVMDFDAVGGGQRPFNLNIIGSDQKELEKYALALFEKLKNNPGLKDVDVNYRPGKPEFQIVPDLRRMQQLGLSTVSMGQELRTQVEGATPAKFREKGIEYDVRVRVQEDQRDIKENFSKIFVPNINGNLVKLSDVATPVETEGPAKVYRQDRGRYIQFSADMTPGGGGMGGVMSDIQKIFQTELPLPQGMRYNYVGQAENFQELGHSVVVAMGFGILFIFMVLASLYESFVTPFTIMLALPLALCGSFAALFVTGQSLDIFSMIGCIMLLGVATKNSILLVDYANQLTREGLSRYDAMKKAGKTRLRPILMTTMALIVGSFPIALGLNEASRQRKSMGVAIIGGLISSTLLTLVVVPAAYSYIDRFRVWSRDLLSRVFRPESIKSASASPSTDAASGTSGVAK